MAYLKSCTECSRLMRPSQAPKSAYTSETVVHGGRGLCKTCYTRRWRWVANREAHPVTLTPELEKIRHETNVRGLQRFMARIRGKSRV
jgi:hypothetical protein